jgi:hypothetical protein
MRYATVLLGLAILPVVALLLSVEAKADILCTQHNGCRETGITLRNNGAAYSHLPHTPRNMTKEQLEGKAPRPTRVLRTIYN